MTHAFNSSGQPIFLIGLLAQVAIVVNGQQQPLYQDQQRFGKNVAFVEGVIGQPYAVLIISRTTGRLECLQSVDGRHVASDEEANYHQRGRIVAREWLNAGYRINDQQVREFVFSDPAVSITNRATNSVSNVGVIGIAIFKEHVIPCRPSYMPPFNNIQYSGGMYKDTIGIDESDLGTAMGQAINDPISHDRPFTRASMRPDEVLVVHYRSREWLERYGLIPPHMPDPFPGSRLNITGYDRY